MNEELKLILQEYVLTANNPNYGGDYSIINNKFPELADVDPSVLQEYVLTANNPNYDGDFSVINSKFPELFEGTTPPPSIDVDINITEEIKQELSSLGLSGEEFEVYQQGIKNAIIEVENEMPAIIKQTEELEDVVEMRTEKSSAGGILSGMNVKSPEKIIVGKRYVFHEFLNEDKSNIEDAKERWIQQERQKLQTVKLEEVFSELKSDVMPTWTGPVGFLSKIAGGISSIMPQPGVVGVGEEKDKDIDQRLKENIGFGYTKKELEYEKVKNILHKEYTEKLDALDKNGSKIVDNLKLSNSQYQMIDAELKTLNAQYKISPPTTQQEVDYFNNLILTRETLLNTHNKNLKELNEISLNLNSVAEIADMVQRTYSNVEVMGNRAEDRLLKLQSGLIKVAKESTIGGIERFTNIDLNNEEDLELFDERLRPVIKGIGTLSDIVDKKSLELYEEAEKINKFTKKRQELDEIQTFEDFSEFMLDLFSEQALNTAITVGTGGIGLAAVAVGATGNKFTSMDMELQNGRYNPRTGKEETITIKPWQYYVAGAGYGLAEYITERVALNNFKLGTKGFRKAVDMAGGRYSLKANSFNRAAKDYGIAVASEGNAEWWASISQNALDRWALGNKEVGIFDGGNEAFWSGALMSGLGFNAPALAAAGYRAATPSKNWDKINENSNELIKLQEVYDELSLGPKTQETVDAMKSVREQMSELLADNIKQKGLAEQRIDQLSNHDRRTLLDLETQRNKIANQIDKIIENKSLTEDNQKNLINLLGKRIDNLEGKKDQVLNNAMYSSDMRKTTKLTLEDAIIKGLKIKSIEASNNEEALKQALAHVDQSNLDAEQKKNLKDELKQTFNQVDVHVHGFAVGSEQGLPMQFQMKSNATNAKSGNASVHSHEIGHNSILSKLLDPENNADALGLVDEFESYIRNRFSDFSKFIKAEGKFQLTQYNVDKKSVKKELTKELNREPSVEEINDRIYLNKVKIAEEKLAAATDYIRQFHNEKIDKSFKGKLLDMWNKTRNADDVNEIQNGEDIYNMLVSFTAGFEKGEMSGLAAKVISGKVKARKREGKAIKDTRVVTKKSLSPEAVKQIKERVTEIGLTYNMEGGKKLWDEGGSQAAIDEITRDGLLDDLIASKYKISPVPENFVKDVLAQLLPDIRGFNP